MKRAVGTREVPPGGLADANALRTGGRKLVEEHRKHDRIDARLRCWCEADNVTVYARVGNLSEGGLFLRTSTPLQAGSRAILRFRDEEASEVAAPARVVWSSGGGGGSPAGMGLQFEEIDEQVRHRIRQLIVREQHLKNTPE